MKQVLKKSKTVLSPEMDFGNQANRPNFNAMRRMEREHLIEKTGKELGKR